MSYPIEFRRKVLKIIEKKKLTIKAVSKLFNINPTTINRLEPKKKRNKLATKIDMEALEKDVKEYHDAYNKERAQRLGVSTSSVFYALKRLNISRKKSLEHPKADKEKQEEFCIKVEEYEKNDRNILSSRHFSNS